MRKSRSGALWGLLMICLFACGEQIQEGPKESKEIEAGIKKIWVDADLAIGVQNPNGLYGDVDDGFALMQLLQSDKVEVVGISTVFGNTDIDNAFRLGKEIRDGFGDENLAVYKGAAAAIDLQAVASNEAIEAMAEALEKEKLHIMAIGPATNVGLLLLLYPDLATQIKSVVLVAGRRSIDHHFKASESHNPPFPDLNFDLDPNAFRILLQHDIKVVLHPFEISHKVWFGKEELARLEASGEAGKYLAERSQNWLAQWGTWGADKYNPFDLLASAYLISDEGFEYEELPVEIQLAEADNLLIGTAGTKGFKPYLIVSEQVKSQRKVFYYHSPPVSFTEDFLRLFE
ncbi:MAG: nucleoside hydrolase [Bacteroidota bacterium]